MNNQKIFAVLGTVIATTFPINLATTGAITAVAAIAPLVITTKPAAAAWWDSVDGVYFLVGSEPYYFGSYVSNPNLSFADSTWEIRCGGNVCAHGYGRTIPRAVRWLADRLGG
jgi:hypothetical protein